MNYTSVIRWSVFMTMYTSIVLPAYLCLKFDIKEFLFLYIPILSFWTVFFYSQFEAEPKENSNE